MYWSLNTRGVAAPRVSKRISPRLDLRVMVKPKGEDL